MALNKVEICGVNTARLPVLTSAEKEDLFKRIRSGDQQAREEYIKGNLRLVLSVIKRFSSSNENPDDLFQIGCIGLMKAIDNFDTELNVKFLNPAGAKTGCLLPTGRCLDVLDIPGFGKLETTILDVSNPMVLVRARDIGMSADIGQRYQCSGCTEGFCGTADDAFHGTGEPCADWPSQRYYDYGAGGKRGGRSS